MSRQLKPCGTHAAYIRHIQRNEPACVPCKAAHAEYRAAYVKENRERVSAIDRQSRERRARGEYATVDPCGTAPAYQRHRRHGEEPCAACREAWRIYCHEGHKRRRANGSAS